MNLALSWGLPLVGTDVAASYDKLYIFLVYLSIFFFVLVVGGMIVFAFKYKAKPGVKPTYITHSAMLEFIYIVIPTALLMGIFVWGYSVYHDMVSAPTNAYEIRVIGKQWLWQFQYDNGQTSINELYVPMNRPVKLVMTSEDVLHSFFVPNFRIKQDVVPGMYTHVWFEAKVPGRHHLFCTEYCGTSHSGMIGHVDVLTDEQWDQWSHGKKLGNIPDAKDPMAGLPIAESGVANASLIPSSQSSAAFGTLSGGTLVDQGRRLYEAKGCVSCHSMGEPMGRSVTRTHVAPSLKGIFGQHTRLSDGTQVKIDEQYLRDSIVNPNDKIVQGYQPIMPTFKGLLTEAEMNALITYIKRSGD